MPASFLKPILLTRKKIKLKKKNIIIIGSGFSGLSAACYLAKAGNDVTIVEKHSTPGGRARQLKEAGFKFDMGPSWYWMPDVFENFFNHFNKTVSDYYQLKRIDPSYKIYWKDDETIIPADYPALKKVFNKIEKGSSEKLDAFLEQAEYKYKTGMKKLAYKPGNSVTEFIDIDVFKGLFRLDLFSSMKEHVAKYFKSEKLQQLMEFPVLFLGALPSDIPAMYSLMNYADIKGGTWYPEGGMYSVVVAMEQLALELGVNINYRSDVTGFAFNNNHITHVQVNGDEMLECDTVVASADYHFVETKLLPEHFRSYSDEYWEKRVMAPGCLLYYIGLNKKLKNITHHSLFFDADFEKHGREIYTSKKWPEDPLFYVCVSSVSDAGAAPENGENLFFLIPVAAGLNADTEELREKYFNLITERFYRKTGEDIRKNIVYKKSFGYTDFVHDYNAFKGNAYGLANTLRQTAMLKPSNKSKKLKNLYYTGQLTVPGPGVPPSIISGEIVARQIINHS